LYGFACSPNAEDHNLQGKLLSLISLKGEEEPLE
jgi:hypothetical protein